MNDQLLAQLDQRISEHHEHLCQRLDDLTGAIRASQVAMASRLEAHEAYHQRNEHRWGLLKLAERHPFRLAILVFALAWSLLASSAESAQWMEQTLRKMLTLLTH